MADIESEAETTLREIFDLFDQDIKSAMSGLMAPFDNTKNKITRVTFNYAVKPLLELFAGREPQEIYTILNNYLSALNTCLQKRTAESLLGKAVVFRAFMAMFPSVAQRVQDKFSNDYSSGNFYEVIGPIFPNITMKKIESPGTSWVELRNYLEGRLRKKMSL